MVEEPPMMTHKELREQLRAFAIEDQAVAVADEIAEEYSAMSRLAGIPESIRTDIASRLWELALSAALTGELLRQFLQRRRTILDTLEDHRRALAKGGKGNRFDTKIVQRFERLLRIPR